MEFSSTWNQRQIRVPLSKDYCAEVSLTICVRQFARYMLMVPAIFTGCLTTPSFYSRTAATGSSNVFVPEASDRSYWRPGQLLPVTGRPTFHDSTPHPEAEELLNLSLSCKDYRVQRAPDQSGRETSKNGGKNTKNCRALMVLLLLALDKVIVASAWVHHSCKYVTHVIFFSHVLLQCTSTYRTWSEESTMPLRMTVSCIQMNGKWLLHVLLYQFMYFDTTKWTVSTTGMLLIGLKRKLAQTSTLKFRYISHPLLVLQWM